ncbi:MAG: sensor domain-containing diguanylate cyclase [Calditrichales bacterium]|nr:MAG: sensor domain-containing diguanylate cyclase [Calditrichales bacterium]
MRKFLTNIFNLKFFENYFNDHFIIRDHEYIERAFDTDLSKLTSEIEVCEFLSASLNEIIDQLPCQLTWLNATRRKNENWLDSFKPFKYADLLLYKFDEMFKDYIGMHHFSDISDVGEDLPQDIFITINLNDMHYFVIFIEENRWSAFYARVIFAAIQRLLSRFNTAIETGNLKNEISRIKRKLSEKDKSLQVAEKAVKRKVYDLHNLVEASNEIYSILNFRQLINSALLTIIGQIGVQSAFALMYDQSKRSYSQLFVKGFKAREIQKLKLRLDSPLIKFFTRYNPPVYLKDLKQQEGFKTYVEKLEAAGIYILAPIIYAERVQGVIATSEKLYGSQFTQTDFELFHVLVNIISISIENSLHYEAVRNLSLTDEMTNLHNYRSFVSRLKEEINRAKRNKANVSLIIVDIDHFKNYNDTLGHQAGDEALREVGKMLKKTVRDEDIVSRYGGEEFCIIFPGIAKEEIFNLGERIRENMEKHRFYKEKVQPLGKITISLGGSTYPDDAEEMHGLIQKADEALYKAKHLGRNRMIVHQLEANAS